MNDLTLVPDARIEKFEHYVSVSQVPDAYVQGVKVVIEGTLCKMPQVIQHNKFQIDKGDSNLL